MRKIVPFFIVASLLLLALPVMAQEAPEATQVSKGNWYHVLHFKFRPGKLDQAMTTILDHFRLADEAIGREVTAFLYQTGEWDFVGYFPLQEGPSELAGLVGPTNEKWWPALADKWWAALAEQVGGTEKARELVQDFWDKVANYKWEIAQRLGAP
jgi:hypothetical protein